MLLLTKSEHIRSNTELDFEISAGDMKILKQIKRIEDYGDASLFLVLGEE